MTPIERHKQYIQSRQKSLDEIDDPFLQGRYLGIGGSDAPVIMNQSPFKTAVELFHEKTFRQSLPDLSNEPPVQWGHIHEPTLRKHYENLYQCTVDTFDSPFIHPDFPWIRANVDGILPDNVLLEIKTAGTFNQSKWRTPDDQIPPDDSHNIPLDYLIQVQFYMATINASRAVLIVLIGVCDYREYHIPFHATHAEEILVHCNNFWVNSIIEDVSPPSHTLKDVNLEHPDAIKDSTISIDNVLQIWFDIYLLNKEKEKNAKMLIDSAQFEIASYLGDHETLTDKNHRPILTYKTQQSLRIQTQKLRKDHPALARQYSTSSQTRVMRTLKNEY